jgi:hypothetical protein
VVPDLETSDVHLKGPPAQVQRDPFHQHLILREDRVATIAGFAIASTTPTLFDAIAGQTPAVRWFTRGIASGDLRECDTFRGRV